MPEISFQDTIKAYSEQDAESQISRLYPDAVDFELISRETASGVESPRGHFFVFQITVDYEPGDYDDLLPPDGKEDEEEY